VLNCRYCRGTQFGVFELMRNIVQFVAADRELTVVT
jgi:hypothetical protein